MIGYQLIDNPAVIIVTGMQASFNQRGYGKRTITNSMASFQPAPAGQAETLLFPLCGRWRLDLSWVAREYAGRRRGLSATVAGAREAAT